MSLMLYPLVAYILIYGLDVSEQLSEIQNGRLAMLALSGFFHHTIITGKGMLG